VGLRTGSDLMPPCLTAAASPLVPSLCMEAASCMDDRSLSLVELASFCDPNLLVNGTFEHSPSE
jgi:hypothetical protein